MLTKRRVRQPITKGLRVKKDILVLKNGIHRRRRKGHPRREGHPRRARLRVEIHHVRPPPKKEHVLDHEQLAAADPEPSSVPEPSKTLMDELLMIFKAADLLLRSPPHKGGVDIQSDDRKWLEQPGLQVAAPAPQEGHDAAEDPEPSSDPETNQPRTDKHPPDGFRRKSSSTAADIAALRARFEGGEFRHAMTC